MAITITIKKEVTLANFDAWDGAKRVIEEINKYDGALYDANDFLETLIDPDYDTTTEESLNDFIWFQFNDEIKTAYEEDYDGMNERYENLTPYYDEFLKES